MIIRGSLDAISSDRAAGWAFSPQTKDGLRVQAILNTEIIGEAVANLDRPDLKNAGFGDGKCGFDIRFNRPIGATYLPFVAVKPDGCDLEFPRWHPTGLIEFFSAVFRGHPASGRHRSVFGGLWIDRVNAPAVLRGKLDAGQVAAQDGPTLGALIENGVVVLNERERLPASSEVSARLVSALFEVETLRPLLAILEDRPVVLSAGIVSEPQPLSQPSTLSELGGQTECLMLVAPLGAEGVQIEVVRASHRLPEFTSRGRSRWLEANAVADSLEGLRQGGFLDVHDVAPGSVAIVGPGTLQRIRCKGGAQALRLVVVPGRGVPAHLLADSTRKETVVGDRVRAWL